MVTAVRHRRSRDREKEEREGENFKELNWWMKEKTPNQKSSLCSQEVSMTEN